MSDRRYSIFSLANHDRVNRVSRNEAGMLREVRAAAHRDLMERIEITRDSKTAQPNPIFTEDESSV